LVIRAANPRDVAEVKIFLRNTWHDTYDAVLGAERVTEITRSWYVEVARRASSDLAHAALTDAAFSKL
jgi:hypothetical protein